MEEEQLFIKAFNSGYLIAEHSPALIDVFKAIPGANKPYLQGILSGAQQYDLDKQLNHDLTKSDPLAPEKDQRRPEQGLDRGR